MKSRKQILKEIISKKEEKKRFRFFFIEDERYFEFDIADRHNCKNEVSKEEVERMFNDPRYIVQIIDKPIK